MPNPWDDFPFCNEDTSDWEQVTIYTSHGRDSDCAGFLIRPNGEVVECLCPAWEGMVPQRFDTSEFVKTYGKLDDGIDILDIGYWLSDGTYEPPEPDFRAQQGK